MVTTFYPPYAFGGDAIHVQRLTHALARRGHRVDVIHDLDAYRVLTGGSDPAPAPEPEGVRIHGLRSRLPLLSTLTTQQTGHRILQRGRLRELLGEPFDVIHFHNVSLVGGPDVLAFGTGLKLYTAHEHWLVCPTHVLWRHNREPCTGRQCLRCAWHYRRPPQLWRRTGLLERRSSQVDAFLSPSRFSADKHREFGFGGRFRVLPHFLPDADDDGEAATRPCAASEQRFFLFVGRLEKIKGLQDVIPLFGEDAPAELWIAGSGSFERELRRLAEGRRVRFLGSLRDEELRYYYTSTLAVILPSICFEVFPMVVLEAFRDGAPVIARRLGPFPEILERSGGGLLFETRAELRAALAHLADDEYLRAKLGRAGRQAFRQDWSENAFFERYFSIIRELAGERDHRRVLETLDRA